MGMKRIFSLAVVCLLTIGLTASAFANEASTEAGKVVMKVIGDVRKVVNDQKGKVSDEQLDKALQDVIYPVFDFAEMSKQCLGSNWNKATPEEQQEFTKLFTNLLSHTYLSKVRKVDQTRIDFVGETIDQNRGLVRTNLLDKGDNVVINYRVYQNQNRWLVYDLIIENISLASNYRSEFAAIVRKDGIAGLITQLRDKIDTRDAGLKKDREK